MDIAGGSRAALRCVVGIGASAGGVDALLRLLRDLDADLPAALLVVLHVPATGRSMLAPILDRRSRLDVRVAEHGAAIAPGRVYVAPSDRHLLVEDGRVRLDRGPKENAVRPAVDPMFRSLAAAYGERSVGVVLSGALGDGSSGALAIKVAGGTVIVQDPDDATVPSMPESAARVIGKADAVLTAEEIGSALAALADGRAAMREHVPVAFEPADVSQGPERPGGPPTTSSRPECHGPLWEEAAE